MVTDEITKGELAVLSSILIYREPKGQGGPQSMGNIEKETEKLTINPSILGNDVSIYYQLSSPGYVSISVCDISGRRVRALVNENQNTGCHKLTWDGTDDYGRKLSKGIYFVRYENQSSVVTQKVVMLN